MTLLERHGIAGREVRLHSEFDGDAGEDPVAWSERVHVGVDFGERRTKIAVKTSNMTIERRNGTRYISDFIWRISGIDLRYRAPKLNEKRNRTGTSNGEQIAIAVGK